MESSLDYVEDLEPRHLDTIIVTFEQGVETLVKSINKTKTIYASDGVETCYAGAMQSYITKLLQELKDLVDNHVAILLNVVLDKANQYTAVVRVLGLVAYLHMLKAQAFKEV